MAEPRGRRALDGVARDLRDRDYGDAHKNFQDVAKLWSVILETEVTEKQFVLCMLMVKAARLMKTDHEDSWVDICGYGALGGEEK